MAEALHNAVLAYHEIMPESNYAYCVTSSAFAEHLRLFDSLAKSGGQKSSVEITFDDGEQSQLHNALPLLAEHGVSARYFVTPGLIGTAAKFLSWDELKTLQNAGHSIQSHGWSHKFLTFCSDDELVHELRASKQLLEEKLGAAVEEISVPGGRWNRRVIEACAAAGYKRVYVSDPWIANCYVRHRGNRPLHGAAHHNEHRVTKDGPERSQRTLENENALTGQARHCWRDGRRFVSPSLVPPDWL